MKFIMAFGCTKYHILSCSSDGKFVVAKSDLPTGDEVIERICKKKFPLYIEITDDEV